VSETYLEQTVLVVDDLFAADRNTTVTVAEKLKIAMVWTRMLSGIIPEERLQDVLDFAIATKTNTYPVTVTEMQLAYKGLLEQESEAATKRNREEKEANVVIHCRSFQNHFEGEFDGQLFEKSQGMELLRNGFESDAPETTVPCRECRKDDFAVWLERRKTAKSGNSIINDALEAQKLKENDPKQILDRLIRELGQEALKGNGKSREGWEILTRVKGKL
jgi:hypothetical protein